MPPNPQNQPESETDVVIVDDNISGDENKDFKDLVAQRFFGAPSYEKATAGNREEIRAFLTEFYAVADDPERIIRNLENGQLSPQERRAMDKLVQSPELIDEFAQFFVDIVNVKTTDGDDEELKRAGAGLQVALTKYVEYVNNKKQETYILNTEDYIDQVLQSVGPDFHQFLDHLDTNKKIREMTIERPGKFRTDTPPEAIAPYQCRIGAATFLIPPTNIKVTQVFKTGSLSNGAIRQPNTPKTNLGHSETMIEMNLFFPNHESIWGFNGDRADFNIFNWDPNPTIRDDIAEVMGDIQNPGYVSDSVIDYYLSSLRGLITQFKYAPFLPVRNQYLNSTYGITAVSMIGMTVTTVPDFPFVLQVNLQMAKFNFNPFMPMIDDFEQAIHWGKYRQYMGRAAARLDAKVNQGFLIDKNNDESVDRGNDAVFRNKEILTFEGDLLPVFDKAKDIADGRYFNIYYPVTTPSRIFAPDTTDFRQPGEDEQPSIDRWDGILSDLGLDVIESAPSFNFFEYDRAIKRITQERELLYEWLKINSQVWQTMNDAKLTEFLEYAIDKGLQEGAFPEENIDLMRSTYQHEWFYALFDLLTSNNRAFKTLTDQRDFKDSNYILNEWKVPMDKLYIDWSRCIVNGISVNLSNNIIKQQIQLQDEPVHQHIGGGDSSVYVSMIVLGEDNLIRLRKLFDHINGLARIEQAHGVLGFLGIKNVVTALCGIKYVLPIDFEVDTVPGMPHAYNVNMSFVDFDVMQQEREKLSADQQAELIEHFGKRNPFLRIKQHWSAFNVYPDLPLELRDETGTIVGHLDPDWYFRSFISNDQDLFNWDKDEKTLNLIKTYAEIKARLDGGTQDQSRNEFLKDYEAAKDLEEQIRESVNAGGILPAGWRIQDGQIKSVEDPADYGEAEMRQIIGSYGENSEHVAFIDFYPGGYLNIGTINKSGSGKSEQIHARMAILKEDLASENLSDVKPIPKTSGLSSYQREYLQGQDTANKQYESMMKDFEYRNRRGRMLPAFPTYMLWLIDEGGRFAGIKLFDNFYGLNSVIDFSVLQSQDAIGDTLILRLSNIYQKLTTPYNDILIREDDPLYETPIGRWITISQQRYRNLDSGLFSTDKDGNPNIIDVGHVRLKPGVRIHMRMGYGSNPNGLQTVFNGVITEVQQGDIMTVVAQSDAVELTALVNSTNAKGHTGKIDGGLLTNFWLSEPRDLMVRLLSMGSSRFKEWISWGSKGVIFSESRFGIRHFGTMLYEEMTAEERVASYNMNAAIVQKMSTANTSNSSSNQFLPVAGEYISDFSEINAANFLPKSINGNLVAIGKMLWLNQASKRDYEIFKRNIYPGNGTGIAQFMGGDMVDAGVILTTATAFYESEQSGTSGTGNPAVDDLIDNIRDSIQNTLNDILSGRASTEQRIEQNKVLVDEINKANQQLQGVSAEELTAFLEDSNQLDMLDVNNTLSGGLGFDDVFSVGKGLLDFLISSKEEVFSLATNPLEGILDYALPDLGPFGALLNPLKTGTFGTIDALYNIANFSLSTTTRLRTSSLGKVLGLQQEIGDDDLYGYDEVAFRAQTYMKTVWDLFQICAALLPNYIVGIRPFEDRSTIFYGKPHWLYTSGVIPISGGVSKDLDSRPRLEEPDQILTSLLNDANKSTTADFQKLMRIVDDTDALKDITDFTVGTNIDPYDAGSNPQAPIITRSEEDLAEQLADFQEDVGESLYNHYKDWLQDPQFSYVGYDDLEDILNALEERGTNYYTEAEFKRIVRDQLRYQTKNVGDVDAASQYMVDLIAEDTSGGQDRFKQQLEGLVGQDPAAKKAVEDLFKNDPITFAYQFGWAFTFVPAVIDPDSGFGLDSVGTAARKQWDENFVKSVDAPDDGKKESDAIDIWRDFRSNFPGQQSTKDIYFQFFPLSDAEDKYDDTIQLFMRFMWQDPFNRAWVINAAERQRDLIPGQSLVEGVDWDWKYVREVWKQFLGSGDLFVDANNVVQAPAARRFMQNNQVAGNTAGNVLSGAVEDVKNWWDDNIGLMIGIITDTVSGVVDSIRLSLAQMGAATSMAGLMQQQSNMISALFNDSRYYQQGAPGSLERLIDNPFTREYGEPVIEIREPFQRVHYVSSFDAILSNEIRENLTEVPTVVTAVSDGKNPVTVHFDKGVPPDRQVETTVETGLYWDNVFGDGLLGIFQPLIHPFEALRGVEKVKLNSSDQLSARRVALYHLKKGLQGIYDGELTVVGNADIRPFDLVYVGDVYERMYGFVEVDQVIHHFTPENGFVTSITPNPIVTVNDPVRWSMMSYIWGKMNSYNLRNDVRAVMNVKAEREVARASEYIKQEDVYKYFSTQMQGSMQYTQGNSALVRDIGAIAAAGGIEGLTRRDEIFNQAAKMDIVFGSFKGAATLGGGVGGFLAGGPFGAAVGGTAGYIVGDLAWEAWQWVKDNLLDQHGCYIQYLTKDGEPMDAGLGYYKGVAAGTNHSISLFPRILGVNTQRQATVENGHYRITTDDLLASMGWTEVDTISLYKDTSWYVNQVNAEILDITGRDPSLTPNDNYEILRAKVLDPIGEAVAGESYLGVIDGDTIQVRLISGTGSAPNGPVIRVRLSNVNTYEVEFKDNPTTSDYNEIVLNPSNDLGRLATEYMISRFTNELDRFVVLRVDKRSQYRTDRYGRTIATIFHNVPFSTPASERLNVLEAYASRSPAIPFDSYLSDGRPYTLNWEMIMTGYGNIDLRESLWDTSWRDGAIRYGVGEGQ